jgi:hypothetical protein
MPNAKSRPSLHDSCLSDLRHGAGAEVAFPRYVCSDCASRARSADGHALAFSNVGFDGGYAARYADTGEPYESHHCWIVGVACRAEEARFGGIVTEVNR